LIWNYATTCFHDPFLSFKYLFFGTFCSQFNSSLVSAFFSLPLQMDTRTFRISGNAGRIARLAGEAGFASLRHRPRRRIALAERGKAKATRGRNGPSSLRHLCKAIFETNLCNDNSCFGYGLCEGGTTEAN